MNPFKCRHCDKPAHFYFREGGMLCVDHAKIFCQSLTDDLMARSRLDKSACASLEAPPGTSSAALSGSSGTPAQERPLTPFKNATTFRVTADNSIQESM